MQKIPVNLQAVGAGGQGSPAGPVTIGTGLKDVMLDLHIESSGGLFSPVDIREPLEWMSAQSNPQRIMLDNTGYRYIDIEASHDIDYVLFRVYDDVGDTLTITGNLILVSDKVYGFMDDKSKVEVLQKDNIVIITGTIEDVPAGQTAFAQRIDIGSDISPTDVAVLSVSSGSPGAYQRKTWLFNSTMAPSDVGMAFPCVTMDTNYWGKMNVYVYNDTSNVADIDYQVVLLKL